MRSAIFAIITALAGSGLALAQTVAPATQDHSSEKLRYEAYWLIDVKEAERATYQRLLVVRDPLKQLANLKLTMRPHTSGQQTAAPLPFDHPAITFVTVGKSSLWSDPFCCVREVGEYDPEAQTLVVDGVKSKFEPCPLKDLIHLLENPEGVKQMVHRRAHPLERASLTAKAFVMLLREQSANESKSK